MLVIVKSRERDWFTRSGAELSGAERSGETQVCAARTDGLFA
jgi:hypothetical protein